jgi:hypothetical protein
MEFNVFRLYDNLKEQSINQASFYVFHNKNYFERTLINPKSLLNFTNSVTEGNFAK